MQFDICAFSPEALRSYLEDGLIQQLSTERLLQVRLHDYHDFAGDRALSVKTARRKLLRAEPVVRCVRDAQSASSTPGRVLLFSPRGKRLNQSYAEELASVPRLILVCGRLGGFESKIYGNLDAEEVSVGDYVLNSGEVAAMVVLDAVIRLIPGALDGPTMAVGGAHRRCA